MDRKLLDLYSDYLISSFGQTTATGLSRLLDGQVSHDRITRFLSKQDYTSRDLWHLVKPKVRQIESAQDGVIIFDDTILEKPHSDENEIVCWHYDHSKGRNVKGVNILNCLYHCKGCSIPISFEVIEKDLHWIDEKAQKLKRKSSRSKNELLRQMLKQCQHNQVQYKYVLMDNWFASKENLVAIKQEYDKAFISGIKSNRLVALSFEDKRKGNFQRIDSLDLEEGVTCKVYLKGLSFEVALLRKVFTNKDGSTGELYLVCSETEADYDTITTIYHRRWSVEVYHKSLKQNTALGRSPTRTMRTQSNHFFAAIYSFFKLECLSLSEGINQFAFRDKLYLPALKASFKELQKLHINFTA